MNIRLLTLIIVCVGAAYFFSGNGTISLFGASTSKPPMVFSAESLVNQMMGVQEAYDAIPHKRTTFDPQQVASMSREEADYLDKFFHLVDLAVVERVETLSSFMKKGGADNQNSMEILRQMEALSVPTKLKTAHDLVVTAIYEHKQFFDNWRQNPERPFSPKDTLVQSSSSKIKQAYSLYMATYPNESAYNKEAFFQHLCALDFI